MVSKKLHSIQFSDYFR